MLIKDGLKKIVYKATIMTYEQSEMSSSGKCVTHGYSSDLRKGLFADCELEHITYDSHRKRVALTITKENLKSVVDDVDDEVLRNFLIYHHGFRVDKGTSEKDIRALAYQVINRY